MATVVMDVLTALDERSAAGVAAALEAQFAAAGRRAGATFAAEITGAEGLAGVAEQAERHGLAAGTRFMTGLVSGVGHTDMKDALTEAMGRMAEEGSTMGAATGGAIAAGVLAAFATLGIEVGEKFAAINRDITVNTAASGAALDELKSHADALVGSLDTAANKVGADMGTIAARLHLAAGPELDNITRHVEILRDRFGSFDTGQFTAALTQMNVAEGQVDSTLASLMATSRQYGGNILPQLVQGVAQYGTVFKELHITMQQAVAMEGEMIAKGVPLQQGLVGIEAASKAWMKAGDGRSFDQFVRDVAESMEYYAAHGQEAKANELAVAVFAQRRWAQSKEAAQAYLDVVRAGSGAFNQSPEEIDKFAEETRTLRNEWDHLKNSLAQALAPTGETLVSALGHVVDTLAKIPGLVEFVAGSFGAWAVIAGVSKLTTALGVIVTTMRTQVPAAAAEGAAATEAASVSMAASLGRVSVVIGGIIAGMEIAKKTWPTISHMPGAGIASPQGLDWARGQLGAGPKVEAPWNMSDDEAWHRKKAEGGGEHRPETATPGEAGGGAPGPGGAPAGLIDPGSLMPGAKLPKAPELPYSSDYGQPPLPGETPEHYRARQETLSKAHDLEEKRARLTQLEHDNNAKQDDVVKARNAVLDAERAQNESAMSLYTVENPKPQTAGKPSVPMPSGFNLPPRAGQTSQQYQAEHGYYESQGKSAEAEARLRQVESDATATAEDLTTARNELAAAEHNEYEAQMRLHDAYLKTTDTAEELGAKLDNDFGISKGLPGIVENFTKAMANLTMAPVLGALGVIGSNSNVPKGAGGLIGMAAISGAFGPDFTGIPRSGGAGPGGSYLPPGASYGPGGYPNTPLPAGVLHPDALSRGGFGPGSGGAANLHQDQAGRWHSSDPWWEGNIQAESGGNIAPPGNPTHFGLFQFSQSTWDSVASQVNPSWVGKNPGTAPADVQAQMAQANYDRNKGNLPGQWANPFVNANPGGTTGRIFGGGGGGVGPGNPPAAAGPQAASRPGEDPREFAHRVMEPYWESMGLKVGDHAADKYGEHQHGALDVMIPNLATGQQVVQRALQDPNVQGIIFNNQTFGYGHGATPQDYSAGHTGDPNQDHQNHVHIFYQPGNQGNIKPGAPGVGMTALGPGAVSSGASFGGGDGSIPIPLPVTIVGGGGDLLGGGGPVGSAAGPGAAPGPGAPPGSSTPSGGFGIGGIGTDLGLGPGGASATAAATRPGAIGGGDPKDPTDNRPGGGGAMAGVGGAGPSRPPIPTPGVKSSGWWGALPPTPPPGKAGADFYKSWYSNMPDSNQFWIGSPRPASGGGGMGPPHGGTTQQEIDAANTARFNRQPHQFNLPTPHFGPGGSSIDDLQAWAKAHGAQSNPTYNVLPGVPLFDEGGGVYDTHGRPIVDQPGAPEGPFGVFGEVPWLARKGWDWAKRHFGSGGAVPIIAHEGEHVLTRADVAAMGGQSGVYNFRQSLHYDIGGDVNSQGPAEPPAPSQPSQLQGQQAPVSMGPGGKGANQQGILGMMFSALGNKAMGAAANDAQGQQGPTQIGGVGPAQGTGSGFGGINEALIGAAAGAAGPMGIGAQMGLKLANRAIAFGGQAAGAIAKGAIETWLPAGGSQLAQNNWATRILGGIVGAHPQIPNMAGKPAAGPLAQTGPTPESIAANAFPDAPKSGGGPPPGPAGPMVNIEHYEVKQTEDHAGQDLARHQQAGSQMPSMGR